MIPELLIIVVDTSTWIALDTSRELYLRSFLEIYTKFMTAYRLQLYSVFFAKLFLNIYQIKFCIFYIFFKSIAGKCGETLFKTFRARNTDIHFKQSSSIFTQEEGYQLSQISHVNEGPIFNFSCLRILQKQNVSFTLILDANWLKCSFSAVGKLFQYCFNVKWISA